MTERPIPSAARPRHGLIAMLLVLGLALVACGGGGGGGGGGDGDTLTLRVAVVNETEGDAAVSLDVAGTPGEETVIATCSAQVLELEFPAFEDWVLSVAGQTAIDSTQLQDNQLDRNLIAEVWVNEDGSVTQESLAPGRLIGAPAQAGICN